ncbi:hypothetical protein PVAP13_5KG279087, partial [Panicum virgatum]
QSHIRNDRLKPKDRSRVHEKKKVVKQIYVVKRDGRKDTSSDLNTIDEKPINVLKTSAIDGNKNRSGQGELKKPKVKRRSPLSRIEAKLSHSFSTSNWQKRKLQKLSAQELKERNMAWVPKGSVPIQDKDDGQAKGEMQLKKKRRSKRRSSNMRFTSNHQNYWSVHHPFDSQILYTPISWNSSINMFGYPSHSYFDPRMTYGSFYN